MVNERSGKLGEPVHPFGPGGEGGRDDAIYSSPANLQVWTPHDRCRFGAVCCVVPRGLSKRTEAVVHAPYVYLDDEARSSGSRFQKVWKQGTFGALV